MPSRFRLHAPLKISDFEQRSVQLIAACALGLAGIVSVQVAPPTRQAVSVFTPARVADAGRPALLPAGVSIRDAKAKR
ncbi:hypothetical protein [Hydrogenophaga sp.]|uniref:hypothetical protein n=1 Tax=Hydrogenophaga sp. TaxID=1904254 RepID=UPI00271AE4E1|nr:hypothetical protein [Hydrogenophaga sp.]MDO9435611.1 hypothetical protein [Hydrogenophaga sp.]